MHMMAIFWTLVTVTFGVYVWLFVDVASWIYETYKEEK